MRTLGLHALLCATALLGLACDAPTARPDAKSEEREAEAQDEMPATRAEAAEPTRDLAQLERELGGNEILLRELGVAITSSGFDGEMAPTEEAAIAEPTGKGEGAGGDQRDKKSDATTTKTTKKDKRNATKNAGAAPGSAPRPEPARPDSDDAVAGGDSRDGREAAKSIQSPPPADRPTEQTEQTEERCPLICSLADNTCELADEICELADLHAEDDTYTVACERAGNDCKLAREACLECLG